MAGGKRACSIGGARSAGTGGCTTSRISTRSYINDSPSHDGWGSPSWFHSVNWFYYIGWLVNAIRGSAGVEVKRAKLRKLREDVLPRPRKPSFARNALK